MGCKMNALRYAMLILFIFSSMSNAIEKCSSNIIECTNTSLGKLEYDWGGNAADHKSSVLLNGEVIFSNNSLQIGEDVIGDGRVLDGNNKVSKVIVYYRIDDLHLIDNTFRYKAYRIFDFSGKKVTISNEFYPPANYDAPIKWVSWGQKNSVIAFEDGSRFRYEKGQVTMIKAGSENNSDN